MWPYGPWGWFPGMWILPLVFVIVMLVFLFRWSGWPRDGGHGPGGHDRDGSAREILDRRYARGEIGREQYQQMKKDLE